MAFRPVSTSNSMGQNLGEINNITRQLNKEQQVKVFNGPNNTQAVTIGKYSATKYGIVIADETGTRRVLVGQAPDDGRPGVWVTIDGVDVIDELS